MSVKTLQNYSISSSLDTINNLFSKFGEEKLLSLNDNKNIKNLYEQLKFINQVCKFTNTQGVLIDNQRLSTDSSY